MKDLLKEYIHPQKHIRDSRVDAHATAILLREGKYSREDIQNAIQDVSPNAPLSKCALYPPPFRAGGYKARPPNLLK